MINMGEIRQKYPQYDDMPDQALADALYDKHYSDMDKNEYYSKIGLGQQADSFSFAPQKFGMEAIHGAGNVLAGLTGGVQAVRNLPHTLANAPHNIGQQMGRIGQAIGHPEIGFDIPGTPKSWENQETLGGRLWHDPNDRGEAFRPANQGAVGKLTEGLASWVPAQMMTGGLAKYAGMGSRGADIVGMGAAGLANDPESPLTGAALGAGGAFAAPYAGKALKYAAAGAKKIPGAAKAVAKLGDFIRPSTITKRIKKMGTPEYTDSVKKPAVDIYKKYETKFGDELVYENYDPKNGNRAAFEKDLLDTKSRGKRQYSKELVEQIADKKFGVPKASLTKEEMQLPNASRYSSYSDIPLSEFEASGIGKVGSKVSRLHKMYIAKPGYKLGRQLQTDIGKVIGDLKITKLKKGLSGSEKIEMDLLHDARNALRKDLTNKGGRVNPEYGKELSLADLMYKEKVKPQENLLRLIKANRYPSGKIDKMGMANDLDSAVRDLSLEKISLPEEVLKFGEQYKPRLKRRHTLNKWGLGAGATVATAAVGVPTLKSLMRR